MFWVDSDGLATRILWNYLMEDKQVKNILKMAGRKWWYWWGLWWRFWWTCFQDGNCRVWGKLGQLCMNTFNKCWIILIFSHIFKNALFKHRDWLCKCVRDRADYPSLSGTWQFTAHCRMNFINILYGGKVWVPRRWIWSMFVKFSTSLIT